ncbi:MAG: ABC transporter substrate-binding protein [Alphaproteobacteria bacterium]
MPLRAALACLAVLAALAVSPFSGARAEEAPTRLSLVLDWFVNPDHAPILVAKTRGYFDEAGLDVEIIAPADPNDPPKLVAAGRADLAITYQPQLHVQVAEGLPLVRVGTLVATPLNTLLTLADGPIRSIADLKGKRVGYSVGGFEDALLGTMLERHGLTLDDVTLINVNFSLSPALLSGQVDAVIGAYRNFELNQLAIENRVGRAFYVEEEGVPPYDELIFVARRDGFDAAAVRRFLDAVERGTQYLVNHPDEAWAEASEAYPDLNDELNKRAWKDTVPRFALRPAALDRARYERFARFLAGRGLIAEAKPADAYAVEVP